ncbi:MAG TPA: uroporphyrinogen decarboxylase family protein [Phycisphaerae bacterium]|nr:uroporphyrinogen decarboxylase family protein [Phycisphaerae bacterium]
MSTANDRGRQCILDALARRPSSRLPMLDLSFWPETLERWHGEGFPRGADPVDYFGLDRVACINDLFDPSFGLPERVLEETEEYRITVDRYGKTVKTPLNSYNPPVMLEPAFRTPEEWARLKPALTPGTDKFNNPAAEADYAAARAAGLCTIITPAEPMWFVIHLTLGFEDGLMALACEPDMVADMIATYSDYLLGMLELTLQRGYEFDALWFWSDLCYRNGMLFSPDDARRLVLPHWKRFGQFAHDHGMRFMFHCDGDVSRLIPLLIEAGCDAIHPLEARAGNDVREYKRLYGRDICFLGNIDADVIATNDRDRIEREVAEKIPVAARDSGYIYHIDHSVPPTVSFDSYRYLLDRVRYYAAKLTGA